MIPRYIVLLPSAGHGSRFAGGNTNHVAPKQYAMLGHKSVLRHTLDVFLSIECISQIVVIASPDDTYIDEYVNISPKIVIHKVGGAKRAHTVFNGLQCIKCDPNDWILVHDAVRCCIKPDTVLSLINELHADPIGGILAVPAIDTIKIAKSSDNKALPDSEAMGVIDKTLPRELLYLAQTPQMFRYGVLLQALRTVPVDDITDDASAVEQLGHKVKLILGDYTNIKLTNPHDICFMENYVSKY